MLLSKYREPIWFARRFGCPLPLATDRRSRVHLDSLRLLLAMYDALEVQDADATWNQSLASVLLPFRESLRSRRHAKRGRGFLAYVIANTSNRKMRLLAIWLRGWYRGTLGSKAISEVLPELDASERRAAVRTLHRLSAWPQLERLAQDDPDPRVRRLATIVPPIDHKDRLSKFLSLVEECPIEDSHLNLYVADHVDLSWTRLAKPSWLIREILERIRRVVCC